MKFISIGLLVVGLILAPGYFIYCSFFSGKAVGSYPIFTQDVSRAGMGGFSTTSSSNAKWTSPVTFALSADMNPITISAKFKYLKPRGAMMHYKTEFIGELTKDGGDIWEEDFSMSVQQKKDKNSVGLITVLSTSSQNVKTFSIEEDGDYQLDVRQVGAKDVRVANLDMSVRRNVIIPNLKIVFAGVGCLVVSIIGLVLVFWKPTP